MRGLGRKDKLASNDAVNRIRSFATVKPVMAEAVGFVST